MQVVVPHRKQAGTNLAIRSNADPAAMPTERMRHRGDNPDLSAAISKAVTPRGFATLVRNLNQWPILCHTFKNLIQRDNHFRRPYAVFFERHELNEAHDHALFSREATKWDDLVFIKAPHQYAIYFHRTEPSVAGGANSGEHLIEAAGHAGDLCESVWIARVHADGHAT